MPATNYFDEGNPRAEAEIQKHQVIVTKYKNSIKGYREYGKHHYMATTALDVKFGIEKHFIPMSCEVKVELGNAYHRTSP